MELTKNISEYIIEVCVMVFTNGTWVVLLDLTLVGNTLCGVKILILVSTDIEKWNVIDLNICQRKLNHRIHAEILK